MSYAGEYNADEYPSGHQGPRYGYAGSKAVAARDETIAHLKDDLAAKTTALREAAELFRDLGLDLGTFTGDYELDRDEQRIIRWLSTYAPTYVPRGAPLSSPSEDEPTAHFADTERAK